MTCKFKMPAEVKAKDQDIKFALPPDDDTTREVKLLLRARPKSTKQLNLTSDAPWCIARTRSRKDTVIFKLY